MNDRFLPDKAIDALDEAGSRVHLTNLDVPIHITDLEQELETIRNNKNDAVKNQLYEEAANLRDKEKIIEKKLNDAQSIWEEECKKNKEIVNEENIADVVSMMTGIPLNKLKQSESKKLSKLFDTIKKSIVGQNTAIEKVVKSIQRNRAGLKDPKKPIGSFIFLGQTGVGKTQLAKVLAKELFESEDSLIRVDMSEYMEKFAVSRLVGAPPGYVGYEDGGQLTEKIRRKPYSVILLDEIEKAHPDVFNMLLQVLDDGFLTDSLGRKIDFTNSVIIMTSNIGVKKIQDFGSGVGFGTSAKKEQESSANDKTIMNSLRKKFAPEFLNRIDEIVIFNHLTIENIHSIIDIELDKLLKRVGELGYTIKISKKAKDFLCEKGYDKKYGARPLKRTIQKHIEDLIASEILDSKINSGDVISLDYVKGDENLKIKIKSIKTPKTSGK
jgi:ATP-dependent Clp protease ATP-binding subunit ClpC